MILLALLQQLLSHPLPDCARQSSCPWPAEAPASAVNLSGLDADFQQDMSGACHDPVSGKLWLCRNGGRGGSKVWRLAPRNGSWFIEREWAGFGDCEALCIPTPAEPNTLFTLDESSNSVQEWDLSGTGQILKRTWNLSSWVPAYGGGLGLEGLCVVPDASLTQAGFVDGSGNPRVSALGMGALTFVAHQNGGRVYVFDLSRANSSIQFVGSFLTQHPESAELCFDATLQRLFVLHGDNFNDIEVVKLSSQAVAGGRRLDRVLTYDYPGSANFEGFCVLQGSSACQNGRRGAFVLIDGGGNNSLYWHKQFPCGY